MSAFHVSTSSPPSSSTYVTFSFFSSSHCSFRNFLHADEDASFKISFALSLNTLSRISSCNRLETVSNAHVPSTLEKIFRGKNDLPSRNNGLCLHRNVSWSCLSIVASASSSLSTSSSSSSLSRILVIFIIFVRFFLILLFFLNNGKKVVSRRNNKVLLLPLAGMLVPDDEKEDEEMCINKLCA